MAFSPGTNFFEEAQGAGWLFALIIERVQKPYSGKLKYIYGYRDRHHLQPDFDVVSVQDVREHHYDRFMGRAIFRKLKPPKTCALAWSRRPGGDLELMVKGVGVLLTPSHFVPAPPPTRMRVGKVELRGSLTFAVGKVSGPSGS